jgi:hypothetical protein
MYQPVSRVVIELDGGSRVGARYRHTTVDMAARMVDAIEARLAIVLRAAEDQASLDQGTVRVARL